MNKTKTFAEQIDELTGPMEPVGITSSPSTTTDIVVDVHFRGNDEICCPHPSPPPRLRAGEGVRLNDATMTAIFGGVVGGWWR